MTDKLEIINYMLSVQGEAPVSDPASNHPSVQAALVVLNRVTRTVQTRGWWFNKEYALTLNPDNTGQVIVPSNTLKLVIRDQTSNYVKRGGKIYDPVNHTFVLNVPVSVTVIEELAIEDLPETAAQYIMHKAAYDFYLNDDGDELKSKLLFKEKSDAWGFLNQEQLQQSKVNSNNRPIVAELKMGIQRYGNSYSGNANLPGGR